MLFSLALLAGAAMVAAQAPAALPACGQTCVNNMLSIAASEFGCAAGNTTCYCSDPRFGYGLRDCSVQACGEAVYSSVLAYGTSVCSGLGAATPTASPTGGATNGTAGGSGSSTPYTTVPVLTTITSGTGAVATSTIGSTTLFTPVGGVVSTASAAASSVASSLSSVVSSAVSSASSVAASASSHASSAASSATSSGFAAQMTAAPMLGGAALAALLMI
ncbi:hypothetical protein BLS_003678 [Venturia inaequalis]|uniref:CFEM domain-containing protein n=1 Tax=Venturia inaequalis TaxID=5025 RepID=A0A8H3UXV1_VENIN|nr:hypothetical protein BLS_003678 [Venturia inaequalis]KAE9977730.1 hypothetical protein EG328_001857 [Venturia inaequalis]KAE9992930.1 hypothetical protein EG327_007238 [Venturia inaequalis]RDI78117.1 Psi-producing oxygenase A [Venturia inaequalis]